MVCAFNDLTNEGTISGNQRCAAHLVSVCVKPALSLKDPAWLDMEFIPAVPANTTADQSIDSSAATASTSAGHAKPKKISWPTTDARSRKLKQTTASCRRRARRRPAPGPQLSAGGSASDKRGKSKRAKDAGPAQEQNPLPPKKMARARKPRRPHNCGPKPAEPIAVQVMVKRMGNIVSYIKSHGSKLSHKLDATVKKPTVSTS